MKALFILHDDECGFCQKCRLWLARQPSFVELRFIRMRSAEALRRFPDLKQLGVAGDLVVISDEGAVYCGPSAYIMCLFALKEYRAWAQRLAHPALLPLARQFFHFVSKQRGRISRWFFDGKAEEVKRRLREEFADAGATEARGERRTHVGIARL